MSLEFGTVLKKNFGADFWLFFTSVKASWAPFCTFLASKSGKKGSSRFALYQCDFSGCWTPFWGSCSPNLAKRGPAACSFGVPWFSFSFFSRWSPFWGSCSPNLAKRGPAACSFGVPWSCLSFSSCWAPFCAAGVLDPPKRGPAASDFRFLPFSLCWTPFPSVSGRDPPKRGAATWHLCSSHFGFNLLFLWRRESALLLCKRIPLRHYNARAWTWPPLLWWETGLLLLLNGFSLSTAGLLFQPWPAEILQKGGRRHISSELYLFPGAGLLFQPWAAEILQKGALQPDVKLASIWIGCASVSSLCSGPLGLWTSLSLCGRSFPENLIENEHCRAQFFRQARQAQSVEQMELNLKNEGSIPPWVMSLAFLLAFACTEKSVLVIEGKCIASLHDDPAEDSLCLACFYCATTMQGL